MPMVGEISVVIDGRGRPGCAIVTTSVEVKRSEEVNTAFALKEGEGHGSLEWWRAAREAYFGRMGCFAPEMLVVCECFEVLEALGTLSTHVKLGVDIGYSRGCRCDDRKNRENSEHAGSSNVSESSDEPGSAKAYCLV